MKFMQRLFGVSEQTTNFLFHNKKGLYKRLAIVLPLAFWGAVLFQIQPIIYKLGIDAITEQQNILEIPWVGWSVSMETPFQLLLIILGLLFIMNTVDTILRTFTDRILQIINFRVSADFEDRFTQFLSKFDSSFIGAENNMRLVDDIHWQINSLESRLSDLLTSLVRIPTSIITILVILPLIHPYLIGFVILYSVVNIIFENISWLSWQKFEVIRGRLGAAAGRVKNWIIYYFPRVVSTGWVDTLWGVFQEKREKEFEVNLKQDNIDRRIKLVKDIILNFLDAGSKLLAGFLFLTSQITIGTFVIFEQYIGRFRGIFDDIANFAKSFIELRFELFKVDFILNLKPKIDYSQIEDIEFKTIEKIEVSGLSFHYPEFYQEERDYITRMQAKLGVITGDEKKAPKPKNWFKRLFNFGFASNISQWTKEGYAEAMRDLEEMLTKTGTKKDVLKNVNISFQKGKSYALVGYNGAGKTTLVNLIKRNIDPSEGEVVINGEVRLKHIHPQKWKRYISSIEQNSFLWPGLTIRDNLQLGYDTRITDEDMLEAIAEVGLGSQIKDLDLIYKENIELSGGQAQLLELARVLIQKKPIVILDEGTNQLDAEKEAHIIKLINQIKQHSIVIFISHRMTSASRCDQIVALNQGVIESFGTHKELLKSSADNLYKQMWQLQVEVE
jgi:ABC-type multidrug transport system fused ATPase/permease subunit